MANVADYKAIKVPEFALNVDARGGVSDDEGFEFELPGHTIKDQYSIVSFMVLDSQNARLKVSINDVEVFNHDLGLTPIGRCYQKICQTKILKNGPHNSIAFEVDKGNCRISDVVLWFQNAA